MIKAAVEMLMKETSGEDVILFLKTRCKKLSSLNSTMSLVRTTLMKNDENRSPDCDYRELSTFQEPGVKEFIGSSLIDQNNIQRSHKTNPIWGPGAEIALHKIKLLPTGMEHFYLSRADSIALKRQQEANQKKKNESVIIIEESEKLVERLSDILRTSTFEHSISHLALALLLCSGRRFVEIMNGKSTFEAVVWRDQSITVSLLDRPRKEAKEYLMSYHSSVSLSTFIVRCASCVKNSQQTSPLSQTQE